MDRRFDSRLSDMLAQAQVPPDLIDGLLSRLETFVLPFTASRVRPNTSVTRSSTSPDCSRSSSTRPAKGSPPCSIKSDKASKSSSGRSRGTISPCSRRARQVGDDLGEADGVIVFDPSAFATKGTQSVGVARQWCGRLGKVENCQVGIYMAYVSRKEHVIVNTRLYLPEEGPTDRRRCRAAGVPETTAFRTRHELAWEMLDEHGSLLPHAWVAGDDERGRPTGFRTALSGRGERYLRAVPSN